jgi:transcriptional regulator with XRE-family HTH domain
MSDNETRITLRECRESLGMTQRVLSERSGVTIGTISAIEKEHRGANIATLEALSDALGVNVAAIKWPTRRYQRRGVSPTSTAAARKEDGSMIAMGVA